MQRTTSFAIAFRLAAAVVYRDDLTSADYEVDQLTEYPNVFNYDQSSSQLPPEEHNCAATLIGPRHAITAAHCFDKNTSDFDVLIGGVRHTVVEVINNPCYNFKTEEPISSDLSVLVLDSDSEVTPAAIYQSMSYEDEVGQEIHVVGWGQSGPIGSTNQNNADYGVFHAGRNIVEDIWNGMLMYTMDDPNDGGLDKEAMAWDGDSGGPAFIDVNGELQIAGVNSFGFCCQYGMNDYYTRTGGVAYDWIQSILNGNEISPNCSAYPGYELDVDPRNADAVFDEFDKNDDSKLSLNECLAMYRANGDIFGEESANSIKNKCKRYDEDGDNALSPAEYASFISPTDEEEEEEEEGDGPDNSECGQLFQQYDKNGNDELVWKEWWKLFRNESDDCDGLSKWRKRRCIKELKEDARDLAEDYDENDDRRLSWEEFQEMCDEIGIETE